ncbi:MAG TPA: hypothetical protein VEI06_13850 [Gemmatimonadaceae bacterium]|nr:hypothetical protein [Gemmatimonadaceae bacterium]
MTLRFVRISLAAACATLVAAACGGTSSNNGPTGPTPAELAGTYNLVSFNWSLCPGTLGPTTSPAATGTLVLTAGSNGAPNTYDSQISIPDGPAGCEPPHDQGTFTVTDTVWNQTSSTQGGLQLQGTVSLSAGGQLKLNVIPPVVGAVATVWQRQ